MLNIPNNMGIVAKPVEMLASHLEQGNDSVSRVGRLTADDDRGVGCEEWSDGMAGWIERVERWEELFEELEARRGIFGYRGIGTVVDGDFAH